MKGKSIKTFAMESTGNYYNGGVVGDCQKEPLAQAKNKISY